MKIKTNNETLEIDGFWTEGISSQDGMTPKDHDTYTVRGVLKNGEIYNCDYVLLQEIIEDNCSLNFDGEFTMSEEESNLLELDLFIKLGKILKP